ncbi:MAG: hypothetical protein ACHWZW_05710 [Spirulina sp.]
MFKRLAYPGVLGLILISLTLGGARANPSLGLLLREQLGSLPGMGWLNPATPIADLGQHRGGTAYFEGQVTRHLPLLDGVLYQVTDPSGAIWVKATTPPPDLGQQVSLRATIRYESILMRGQDIGEAYAEELERTVRN